jgi:hypothetical protein
MKLGDYFPRTVIRRILTHRGTSSKRRAVSNEQQNTSIESRRAKVFAALLASMIAGAIILKALGSKPPSARAFSLSGYHLKAVEAAIDTQVPQSPDRWNYLEIYYSGTKTGDIEQLASLSNLARPEEINCHFVICNGFGGGDGEIQSTEKWQRQRSAVSSMTWQGNTQTIRICLVADGKTAILTDGQIEAVAALSAGLCKRFNIQPECINVVAGSTANKAP